MLSIMFNIVKVSVTCQTLTYVQPKEKEVETKTQKIEENLIELSPLHESELLW